MMVSKNGRFLLHKYILLGVLALLFGPMIFAKGALASLTPKVYYFSNQKNEVFESRVKPFFAKQAGECKSCQIVDWTPYDDKGEFKPELLKEQIEKIPEENAILFFDWNEKADSKNEFMTELLSQKIQKGMLVIANAGVAKPNAPIIPLNKSIFGRIQDVVIIGELEGRDVLPAQGFYGPQMLTAVRPPKDIKGQGFGPLLFVSRFTMSSAKKAASEWLTHFRERKAKSRGVWPEMEEFLPR
jgi:hypothetical protein